MKNKQLLYLFLAVTAYFPFVQAGTIISSGSVEKPESMHSESATTSIKEESSEEEIKRNHRDAMTVIHTIGAILYYGGIFVLAYKIAYGPPTPDITAIWAKIVQGDQTDEQFFLAKMKLAEEMKYKYSN